MKDVVCTKRIAFGGNVLFSVHRGIGTPTKCGTRPNAMRSNRIRLAYWFMCNPLVRGAILLTDKCNSAFVPSVEKPKPTHDFAITRNNCFALFDVIWP